MRRASLGALVAVLLLALAPQAGAQRQAAPAPPKIAAKAWILVDARTGRQLAGKAISRPQPIASTTKLMTAYLTLDRLKLNQTVSAAKYKPQFSAESRINLRAGERMKVSDLLYALLLESANDAAVTLATNVSGSVPDFVDDMNRRADAMGLVDTSYSNPIGLDAPTNRSSARDLATLTLRLRKNQVFRRIVDTGQRKLTSGSHPRHITTRNKLILRVPWVTGVKTGHTLDAGYVLVGSGTRKGASLVSVVLGAPSEAGRDAATLKLLNYGLKLYRRSTPVRQGEVLANPELRYRGESLPLEAAKTLRVSTLPGERIDEQVVAPDDVDGPIKAAQLLGHVKVTVDGHREASVPLVATRGASKASALDKVRSKVANPITLVLAGVFVIGMGVALARRRSA